MSIAQLKSDGVPIKLWTPAHEVEGAAINQLKNIAALPWCFHHVAAMPDWHLGKGATVGGANLFIELCIDPEARVWLMLHSGSRNIGKELAEIHIAGAKKFAQNQDLPARDLGVFLAGTEEIKQYRHDLFWAQRYA